MALASTLCALFLGGCSGAGSDVFSSQNADEWFSKPFANFSKGTPAVTVADTSVRPATPEDFVDGSGRCAFAFAPIQPAVNTVSGDLNTQNAPSGAPTVAGGIALLMTECEVVARAGAPERVEIGANPGGERTAVLTYMHGPWPGIYSFNAGRLAAIDRVAEPEVPKPEPKKKKPGKPKTAARQQ
jgi:hypothetical protein